MTSFAFSSDFLYLLIPLLEFDDIDALTLTCKEYMTWVHLGLRRRVSLRLVQARRASRHARAGPGSFSDPISFDGGDRFGSRHLPRSVYTGGGIEYTRTPHTQKHTNYFVNVLNVYSMLYIYSKCLLHIMNIYFSMVKLGPIYSQGGNMEMFYQIFTLVC